MAKKKIPDHRFICLFSLQELMEQMRFLGVETALQGGNFVDAKGREVMPTVPVDTYDKKGRPKSPEAIEKEIAEYRERYPDTIVVGRGFHATRQLTTLTLEKIVDMYGGDKATFEAQRAALVVRLKVDLLRVLEGNTGTGKKNPPSLRLSNGNGDDEDPSPPPPPLKGPWPQNPHDKGR